jgi:hypothetical protein
MNSEAAQFGYRLQIQVCECQIQAQCSMSFCDAQKRSFIKNAKTLLTNRKNSHSKEACGLAPSQPMTKLITYGKSLNIYDVIDKQKMGKVMKTFVIRQLRIPVGRAIHKVINRFCGKNNTN